MLFGALPHAQNRGFWCSPLCQKSCSRSCFWCSPSCQKSSFLVLSFVYCFPSCKKSCSRSRFLVLSLVHKIVVFGALPCAKNRALDRAFGALLRAKNRPFWCSPSCIAFPRAKNRALDPAFWCSPSCTKSWFLVLSFVYCFPSCKKSCSRSCFFVLSLVHKIVVFGALPCAKNRALDRAFGALLRAKNRAFWCSPSCIAFPRAKNRALDRAFWCSPSCTKSWFLVLSFVYCFPSCKKSCSRSCFLVLSFVPKIVLFGALLRVLLSLVPKIVL